MWVYVLRSEASGRYYCGQTSDLSRRIRQHNEPSHQGSQTTKRFKGPWRLVRCCECPNRSEAMKQERAIKKRGIARFLQGTTAHSRSGASGC